MTTSVATIRQDATVRDAAKLMTIIRDVVAGRFSDLHNDAFITVCAGDHLDLPETNSLTKAMIDVGERVIWPGACIMDKHCVGGQPGNCTTPFIVPIIAACGQYSRMGVKSRSRHGRRHSARYSCRMRVPPLSTPQYTVEAHGAGRVAYCVLFNNRVA